MGRIASLALGVVFLVGHGVASAQDAGAPPTSEAVRVVADEIVLAAPVTFDVERARIRPASEPTLDALVAFLLAHPELGVVRVEGHMDPATWREREHLSSRLWLDRARVVVRYLVEHGVDPVRLVADSLVTDRPVCDPSAVPRGRRHACRRQNDRIVLRVSAGS